MGGSGRRRKLEKEGIDSSEEDLDWRMREEKFIHTTSKAMSNQGSSTLRNQQGASRHMNPLSVCVFFLLK